VPATAVGPWVTGGVGLECQHTEEWNE